VPLTQRHNVWRIAPVIGSVVNFSGYFALGGFGLTGLSSDSGAAASGALGGNASRLLDGAGFTLQALDNSRAGIDQIKSALTKLRDTLQAARDQADAVSGRTQLQPVVADVEQTQDKPTYVTINGAVVQTGTITVSLGTRPLIVGYERANRSPLAAGDAVRSLASTVATLVSAVGADGTNGFAADVSALLQNSDFTTAVNTPDTAAIEAAIGRIDGVLAKTAGLGSSISARASAAAQVNLGGLLLGAAPNAGAASSAPAGLTGDSLYQSTSSSLPGTTLSTLA
jgi:hypothetical protein